MCHYNYFTIYLIIAWCNTALKKSVPIYLMVAWSQHSIKRICPYLFNGCMVQPCNHSCSIQKSIQYSEKNSCSILFFLAAL